jgi:hypothetical protein
LQKAFHGLTSYSYIQASIMEKDLLRSFGAAIYLLLVRPVPKEDEA